MEVIKNQMGVPALIEEDGTAIYLDWTAVQELQAIAMSDEAVIEMLFGEIKDAVSQFVDIDPSLPTEQWLEAYRNATLITNFQVPISVLSQAQSDARHMQGHS